MSKKTERSSPDLAVELADLVEKLTRLGKEEGTNLKEALETEFRPKIEKIKKRLEETREKGEAWAGDLEKTVVQNPWKSLLTAAVVGYLVGKFFDRD